MRLIEAIREAITPEVFNRIRRIISPPEMLKEAALQCFSRRIEGEVAEKIREALMYLHTVGNVPPNEKWYVD